MKQFRYERAGIWVVAVGWLLFGTGGVTADRITVGETTYEDVLVVNSTSSYYILLPDEGRSISVPRDEVDESQIVISEDQVFRDGLKQRYTVAAEAAAATKGPTLNEQVEEVFKVEEDAGLSAEENDKASATAGPNAPDLKLAEILKMGPLAPADATIRVVEFWATWCGPCRSSIPHLTELQAKYAPKGVAFVGVTSEPSDVALPYVTQMGDQMNYTVVADYQRQTTRAYASLFGVSTIPHAYIVGGDGKVAWHGHPMDPQLESMLNLLTQ